MKTRTLGRRSASGFAAYATVLVLLLGVVSAAVTFYRPASQFQGASEREADVFSGVKAALIGYAARQGVFRCTDPGNAAACVAQLESSRLGEFPCPDVNNDGIAEPACPVTRLGRVPWRTLGIPEPKDRSGETLWYAVSSVWVNNAPNANTAINSSTQGSLSVLNADGSQATATAIAVILSPGAVLSNPRGTALAACGATPNVRRDLCALNYLEAQGTGNNAATGGPFISGTSGDAFNDRLVYILPSEVMPVLEMRLGNELKNLLLEYKYNSACLCYPWTDSWSYSGGIADYGINRGRFPSNTAYSAPDNPGEPENWGTGKIPRFPQWLFNNNWHNQVYYIAARQETNTTRRGCLTCTANAYLTIQGAAAPLDTAAAALITPGTAPPGVNRMASAYVDDFSQYFEDAMNRKSACPGRTTEHANYPESYVMVPVGAACDTLTVPTSRAHDRDRLFTLPPEDAETVCSRGARALYDNVTCHDPGPNKIAPVCANLNNKIKTLCSPACVEASNAMVTPPCQNNLQASGCDGYHKSLLSCRPR